jgi:hypothetical protein
MLLPVQRIRAERLSRAEVAELADAHGSGPCTRKGVGVRVPSSAPVLYNQWFIAILHFVLRFSALNWSPPAFTGTGWKPATPNRQSFHRTRIEGTRGSHFNPSPLSVGSAVTRAGTAPLRSSSVDLTNSPPACSGPEVDDVRSHQAFPRRLFGVGILWPDLGCAAPGQ